MGDHIMLQFLQRLVNRKDEKGASAVEYGLLVAAIAALIVIIVFALGGVVKDVFSKTCTSIQSGAKTSTTCPSS
jgi:pilus assembly protein Flp/PilA